MKICGNFELVRRVPGYGHSAEVLEPDWLRLEIAEEIEAVHGRYGIGR